MRISHIGRAAWILPVLVLAIPMLLPIAGQAKKKPPQVEERPESPELASIINRVILSENRYNIKMMAFSPRVETYLQYYEPGEKSGLSDMVRNDGLFLGRLKFDVEMREVSFMPDAGSSHSFFPKARLHLDQFALIPLAVDPEGFDRQHYIFEPIRWEYLGDIRCLAIDVHPRLPAGMGAFQGRIWVEDHDYAIVRMNGTRVNPPRRNFYVHFDCWRENLQPGLWVPVYIYSQESDLSKQFRYKSETRLWGYDLTAHREQQEWTSIRVDAPAPVRDTSEHAADMSPLESQRQLSIEAERNVLDRLERARLISPPGPVDKVLETVVNNLKVTNHLENMPPVQCRVMLTSSLESFSLAYTIVVSRGLIDVLPDEASLAMVLAHELAHIALGHKLDTKYAFNDRLVVSDEELLSSLDLARDSNDEVAADAKGLEFLKSSPYNDKLSQAGLFLRAAVEAAPHIPNMFGAHLGNGLTDGDALIRMSALMMAAPALSPNKLDQIAALPLGSRVLVNAWNGSIAFTDRKAVPIVDASEKLPFRVTPLIPYLKTCDQLPGFNVSARN